MASGVLIIAETGAGKTTAISTLDPKETFIVNISGKPLSFPGWKKMYTPYDSKAGTGNQVKVVQAEHILATMDIVDKNLPHIKNLIIEDFNYMSSFELMSKVSQAGYDKFNVIAKHIFDVVTKVRTMRDDLIVFFTNHPEVSQNIDGEERIKAKTAGQMIDKQIVIEGLFSVVLYGRAKKEGKVIKHIFETQTDGKTPAKSPIGMFEATEISNDLALVRQALIKYEQ